MHTAGSPDQLALYELTDELGFHVGQRIKTWRSFYDYISQNNSAYADVLHGALCTSTTLVEKQDTNPDRDHMKFTLTQRALGFAATCPPELYPTIGEPIHTACLESELFFARSLAWHGSQNTTQTDHQAALVLRDTQGRPFAYQKASGLPTAYTWREATIAAAQKNVRVPAGAIIRYVYDEEMANTGPAYIDYVGTGLAAPADLQPPRDVEFIRLTIESLPTVLREKSVELGVWEGQSDSTNWVDHQPYAQLALTLSNQVIERTVMALI